MYVGVHTKYPLFLSDFYKNCIFLTYFRKRQIPNFVKIHPTETELLHANRRTGNVALCATLPLSGPQPTTTP